MFINSSKLVIKLLKLKIFRNVNDQVESDPEAILPNPQLMLLYQCSAPL